MKNINIKNLDGISRTQNKTQKDQNIPKKKIEKSHYLPEHQYSKEFAKKLKTEFKREFKVAKRDAKRASKILGQLFHYLIIPGIFIGLIIFLSFGAIPYFSSNSNESSPTTNTLPQNDPITSPTSEKNTIETFVTSPRSAIDFKTYSDELKSETNSISLFLLYKPSVESWFDELAVNTNTALYSDTAEYYLDKNNKPITLVSGNRIVSVPKNLAPVFTHIESTYGISKYLLMAIINMETSFELRDNHVDGCSGISNLCSFSLAPLIRRGILPSYIDTQNTYDSLATLATMLWTSNLGESRYREIVGNLRTPGGIIWPNIDTNLNPFFLYNHTNATSFPVTASEDEKKSIYTEAILEMEQFYKDKDNEILN